jgi:PncC family amidohydrolase
MNSGQLKASIPTPAASRVADSGAGPVANRVAGPAANRVGLQNLAQKLIAALQQHNKKIVFAESCTGGLVTELLTGIPGASCVVWGGFVTYTVDAKCKMLGISRSLIDKYGAVSGEIAIEMANRALQKSASDADIAVSITGLAGPGNDAEFPEIPVGTVFVGVAHGNAGAADTDAIDTSVTEYHFSGGRDEVRNAAALAALEMALTFF